MAYKRILPLLLLLVPLWASAQIKFQNFPNGTNPIGSGDFTWCDQSGASNKCLFANIFASPLPIGSTTPNTGAFTSLNLSTPLAVASGGSGASSLASAGIPVFSGSITSGHCVQWLTSTTVQDAGAPCGTGSGGSFATLTGGVNTSASMFVGSGASLAATGSGSITATAVSGVVPTGNGGTGATSLLAAFLPVFSGGISSGHCAQWSATGILVDSGGGCGSGGSNAFSALTSSTNTSAAMLVGTGATLGATGSGAITATAMPASGLTGTILATNFPALTGDVTNSAGSLATTVVQVNGAVVPATAAVVGTNSSRQIVADSTTGTGNVVLAQNPTLVGPALGTPASGVATNLTGTAAALNIGGNAATATALAGSPTQCTGAQVPTGILANGNANGCFSPTGSGTVNAGTSNQVAYYAAGGNVVSGATLGNGLAIASASLNVTQVVNPQTGTTYAFLASDATKLVTFSNAAAVAASLSAATTTGFTAGYAFDVQNLGAGPVTITPATSAINGGATLVIGTNQGCSVTSDGTNYQVSACTAIGSQYATTKSAASGTSITPSCAIEDNFSTNTASGGTYTINAPTGCVPIEGQKLLLHESFTNSQTASFNATYDGGTAGLPTSLSGEVWLAFRWSSIGSKWDFMASATGF